MEAQYNFQISSEKGGSRVGQGEKHVRVGAVLERSYIAWLHCWLKKGATCWAKMEKGAMSQGAQAASWRLEE